MNEPGKYAGNCLSYNFNTFTAHELSVSMSYYHNQNTCELYCD